MTCKIKNSLDELNDTKGRTKKGASELEDRSIDIIQFE